MSAVGRFVAELRRRGVFHVGGIYAVAIFAVFQVVDIVFPALHLPEWTVTFTVLLGLLGFPVALVVAWAFDVKAGRVERAAASAGESTARTVVRLRHPWLALVASVGAIGLVGLGAWMVLHRQEVRIVSASLDPQRIAVMPFRVGGASPDLAYLREGLVDLLATSLHARDGTHSVDPPTLLRAWRSAASPGTEDLPVDSAVSVARQVGAGWMVIGGIVGGPGALTVNAELVQVANGRVLSRTRLEGSTDSIGLLVDDFAGRILAGVAGEPEARTSLIAGVPLEAVRAWLNGRAEARRGHWSEAVDSHARALRIDSSFVPAALGLIEAAGWNAGTVADLNRARSLLARRLKDLPPVERLEVLAYLGPRYPEPAAGAELLYWATELRRAAPDRPESAHRLAEWLFHEGANLDVPNAEERAAELFSAILEIDSAHAGSLEHLAEISLRRGDMAAVRALADRYRALDPDRFADHIMEWYGLLARSDTAGLAGFRERLPGLRTSTLWGITIVGRLVGMDLETVDRAAAVLAGRESGPGLVAAYNVAVTRGRPAAAVRLADSARRTVPDIAVALDALTIAGALYSDADAGAAARAAARLDAGPDDNDPVALCALEQWRLWIGEATATDSVLIRLRTVPIDSTAWSHLQARFCSLIVETIAAHLDGRREAVALLEQLDSAAATDPAAASQPVVAAANRVISRIREERGDYEGALRAAKRQYDFGGALPFLASRLRDQARLAERIGDHATAVRALRHYVTLRSDPEPSLQDELDRARADLARLVAESRGN